MLTSELLYYAGTGLFGGMLAGMASVLIIRMIHQRTTVVRGHHYSARNQKRVLKRDQSLLDAPVSDRAVDEFK